MQDNKLFHNKKYYFCFKKLHKKPRNLVQTYRKFCLFHFCLIESAQEQISRDWTAHYQQ